MIVCSRNWALNKAQHLQEILEISHPEFSQIISYWQAKIKTNRVRINISCFGKYDAFFIFHDKVFPSYPGNPDTKEGFCFLKWGTKTSFFFAVNPLSSNSTKRSNTLWQFVSNLPTNRAGLTILWGWHLKGQG